MQAGSREEVVSEKEVADRKFAEVLAKAEAEAKHHRVKLVSHIVIGRPAPAIVAFIAQDNFDLLVTGFKGHSALYHRILGKNDRKSRRYGLASVVAFATGHYNPVVMRTGAFRPDADRTGLRPRNIHPTAGYPFLPLVGAHSIAVLHIGN